METRGGDLRRPGPATVRPRISMLGEADIEYVHDRTLRLLADVGFRPAAPRAVALLRDAGALVDDESGVVRLPAALVEDALARAPGTVLLAARDPSRDALLDHTRTYVTHDGMGAMTLDHRTGERRPSTARDLAEAMIVADALDEIGVCWYTAYPCEEPPVSQSLRGLQTMLAGSGKHVQGEVLEPREVPYVMEMLAAAGDDGSWHPERPIFSIVYCPVSPLQHDAGSLETALQLAARGVPVSVYSLALAGATAPLALAGTVVQTNAEVLATLVMLQLASPGCPVIYVGNAGVMDMRTSMYAAASPEGILLNQAITEMGQHYGLPVLSCGFSSDAKELSMQSGSDGASMAVCSMLAGVDLLTGIGMLDAAQLLYLPKLVLDAEVVRQAERLRRGLALDDEHVMLDLSAKVGPGGHFLSARESRRFLRDGEHLMPQLFVRGSYDAWSAQSASEQVRATAAVEQILADHRPKPLPDGAAQKLEDIIRAASEAAG